MNKDITILNIETATQVCSCCLSVNEKVVLNKISHEPQSHSKLLGVFVEEIVTYANQNNILIDAIAVSSGPGSYTGLRIGVSEAKGLAYGLNTKFISIPTLKIMASMMLESLPKDILLCPMIDARRMEVYSSIFNHSLEEIESISAKIIDENSFIDILNHNKVAFFGDGSQKCEDIIKHPNAIFISDIYPLATGMVNLSLESYKNKKFEDLAYFEPFYLKDFVATIPKNKVL